MELDNVMPLRNDKNDEIREIYILACKNLDEGNTEEALRLIEKVVELAPNSSKYWSAKGEFYYEIEDYSIAETAAKRSVELNRKNYFGWLILAHCAFDQHQFQKAAEYFKKYLEFKESYSVYTLLAAAELEFDPRSAYDHAKRALELNPDWDEAQAILVSAKAQMNAKEDT